MFGELALIYNQPRLATVISLCDSSMCLLDQKSFKNTLGKIQRHRDQQKIEFIEKNVISGHSKEYGSLAHTIGINFTRRLVKKGEKLFSQGELPEKVFIVLSGQIRLWEEQSKNEAVESKSKRSQNPFIDHPLMMKGKEKGDVTELAIVGEGQMIGEESLFSGHYRQYNATADVETQVYEMNNERFLVVCENSPPVKQLMMQLAEKKASVVSILQTRAEKAGKKFNIIADNIIKKQINTDNKDNVTDSQYRMAQIKFLAENQRFASLVSRTKITTLSKSGMSKNLNSRKQSVSELEDIDRVIISMKAEKDASRKASQKAVFSRTHRRNYSDHQKMLIKALGKTADSSVASKQSPDNSKFMNIVSSMKPSIVDKKLDYLNLKRTCSVIFKKSIRDNFPSMHSRQLSEKRFKPPVSRIHYRSASLGEQTTLPEPLITQIPSDRQLSLENSTQNTNRLHVMSMVTLQKSFPKLT